MRSNQSMWCWWRCLIPESVCRLPVHVPASHSFPPSFLCCPAVAESNCTFFKFFTTGENTVMFQKTTQKSESEPPPPPQLAVPPYPPTPSSPALPLAASRFSFSAAQPFSLSSPCCCLSWAPCCSLSGCPLSDPRVFEISSAYAVFECLQAAIEHLI